MALTSLSETLKSQNDQLVNINDGIGQINTSFSKWFTAQERARLEDLERERDAAGKSSPASNSSGGSAGGAGGGAGGGRLGKKFGGFGAGLGISRLGRGGLLGKAGIFGISQMMSESVGKAVTEMSGDEDIGAAAANMTKFAGVGALFGKRFALLGGVAGAFATPENIEAIKSIGESLGERATQIKESFANLGVALPSLSDTYKFLSDSSNEVLRSINSIIDMDVKGMQENITGVNALAGLAGGRNLTNAVKNRINNGPKPPTPTNPASAMTKTERIAANNKTASGLSKKKLAALAEKGITVDKGGMKQNGKFMSADKMDDALKSVKAPTSGQSKGLANALKKFKRFGKALKLPIIGPMISAGSIGLILANDDLTTEEKTAQIGVALASIGGGILGTAAGALLGTAVGGPFGAGLLGIGGGILGAFSGDYLANEIAKFLMGDSSEIVEMGKAQNAAMAEGGGGNGPLPNLQGAGGTPAQKVTPSTAAQIKDGTTEAATLKALGGQGTAVIAPQSTSNTSNNSSTNLVAGAISAHDSYDPLAGTRTA